MLEKRDYRVVPGAKLTDVWAPSWDWWQRAGFALYHVGPGHFTGSSIYSKIGLRREIDLRFLEANDALYVDLAFRARITDEGAVGGAVAAVVFFPVAAVGGAISWSQYENEANALMATYWQGLWQLTGKPSQILYVTAPPFGTPYTVMPQVPAPAAKTCAKCGAGLAADWKACPACGTPVA
jgi:hypothetical protein